VARRGEEWSSLVVALSSPEMPASIPRVTLHSDLTLHVLIHYLKETSLLQFPEQRIDRIGGEN
jgi:hypothetical protein